MPEIFERLHTSNNNNSNSNLTRRAKKKCKLNIRNHQLNRTFTAIPVS